METKKVKVIFRENWTDGSTGKLTKANETIELSNEMFEHLVKSGVQVEIVNEKDAK